MTTITIDDALATRLRDLRGGADDFDRVVTEALAEIVRRWEWEAAGRAELRAMLDGPRHTPAEAEERTRRKYGYPDFTLLTAEELADQAEATLNTLPADKVAEARRLGLV